MKLRSETHVHSSCQTQEDIEIRLDVEIEIIQFSICNLESCTHLINWILPLMIFIFICMVSNYCFFFMVRW